MKTKPNTNRNAGKGTANNLQLTDISSNHLTLLSWVLQRHGMDSAAIFAEVGVNAPSTHSPVDRVPLVSVIRVLAHIQKATNNPCIGLELYRYAKLSHLNVLGFALSCSSTLLDFLQRAQRFCGYIGSAFLIEIEEREDHYLLVVRLNPDIYQEQLKDEPNIHLLVESLTYSALGIAHEVYGEKVPTRAVYLFGQPHPQVLAAFECYCNTPPQTGADFFAVEVDKTVMHASLPGANPQLARENDKLVVDIMALINQTNIVHRCERLIIDGLPTGDASLKQAASSLGMSERVLQQQLHDQGLSFSSLVNRIKKTLAMQYLQEDKKNISQIAYMLGFDSASNFSRAFRGWTGLSPREYKNKH